MIAFLISLVFISRKFKDEHWTAVIFASAIVGAIANLILSILLVPLTTVVEVVEYPTSIKSAKLEGPTIAGSFFIGTGSIGTERNYYFYIEEPGGDLKLTNINSSLVSIRRADNISPRRIEYYRENNVPKWVENVIYPYRWNDKKLLKTVLVVPKNAIEVDRFNLNP